MNKINIKFYVLYGIIDNNDILIKIVPAKNVNEAKKIMNIPKIAKLNPHIKTFKIKEK